jgi:hypothetical protein
VRIVHVERRLCILSTGEELLIRFEKLHTLCEQLQQEAADVTVRTWWTPDGVELVEIHRMVTPEAPVGVSDRKVETDVF